MDLETLFAKTPATVEEIKWRVGNALARHPRCRNVEFDIVSMPRTRKEQLDGLTPLDRAGCPV